MAARRLALVECFAEIVDPRIERTKQHLLTDILALAVLAVIAGTEGWEDIEEFGNQKHEWLRQFLRLAPGGNHFAGRQRVLPRELAELVRAERSGLPVRPGEQLALTADHRPPTA